MKKLSLLLLEDNENDAEAIINVLNKNANYEVTLATSKKEVLNTIESIPVDIIILDIMINGKPEGITIAKSLNDNEIDIPFLFLTSVQSKAIFESAKFTKPFSYLLKPFNELELQYTLELVIEKFYNQKQTISLDDKNAVLSTNFIFIRKNNRIEKLNISSINFIKVEEKYCNVNCESVKYLIKLSLVKLKTILSSDVFKQVHRNYLVNIEKIKEIYLQDNLIILDNKDQVPFSERYKNIFIKNQRIFG